MNVFLWVVQGMLAFLYVAGGYYKAFQFDELAEQFASIPRGGWRALGAVEMVGAVLLIVPAATGWAPGLTLVAAVALTLETLLLAAVYARQSLAMKAQNPLVWSVVMALLAAFVAVGRYALVPL